jgi:hypothetical protein
VNTNELNALCVNLMHFLVNVEKDRTVKILNGLSGDEIWYVRERVTELYDATMFAYERKADEQKAEI